MNVAENNHLVLVVSTILVVPLLIMMKKERGGNLSEKKLESLRRVKTFKMIVL